MWDLERNFIDRDLENAEAAIDSFLWLVGDESQYFFDEWETVVKRKKEYVKGCLEEIRAKIDAFERRVKECPEGSDEKLMANYAFGDLSYRNLTLCSRYESVNATFQRILRLSKQETTNE